MNSEELELSLRTEFESHIKSVVAEMRQEFSQFQEKVEAENDKHKAQLDAVFQEFAARLGNEHDLAAGFSETVVEHLRLARDEGARITALAFADAEELEKQNAADAQPKAGVRELSEAIADITAQNSQATILKSLVHHAAQFTPRGAFFIIKNEHFVGWRVFGKEGEMDEQTVREVFFPVASSTALGESVRSLSAVESSFGTYDDDSIYLNKLEFGQPDRMFAIPLVARGRGVAVLYADYGSHGEEVNVEALETLVRVAGLTVEVLAGVPVVRSVEEDSAAMTESADESRAEYAETEAAEYQTAEEESAVEESEAEYAAQPAVEDSASEAEMIHAERDADQAEAIEAREEEAEDSAAQIADAEEEQKAIQPIVEEEVSSAREESEYQFAETKPAEETQFESSPVEDKAAMPEVEQFEPVVEEAPVAAPPAKSRFSDRNVDLPIEVGEDERRLHNDARRFARLLVSEIKLYNEQKVKEGREAQDLYERLREAIDRSRDMYDKRVQPPVAAKFDYFHYELVSSLAEGEEGKLGGNYPGATVN